MTTLVELYAGTAALSLRLFGLRPPVSRIGSKQGYAAAIAHELGLQCDRCIKKVRLPDGQVIKPGAWSTNPNYRGVPGPIDRVLLVDTDPWVCATLRALCSGYGSAVAGCLRAYKPTKAEWARERATLASFEQGSHGSSVADAAHWLYVTAAARGGVGGFKGGHIRRPSVKGWIPSLPSLCQRLQAFNKALPVEVRCARAQDIAPFGDSVVYLDPPYPGRTGYPTNGCGFFIPKVVRAWLKVGATVALSGPDERILVPAERKLEYTLHKVELTHRRKGQTRRSLTRSSEEWLHIFHPTR